MYLNQGRFRFRPRTDEERKELLRVIRDEVPPIARESKGFRGVYFAAPTPDEVTTVWLWDTEADWQAALARFGPLLQRSVVPYLAEPPERVGGEAVLELTAVASSA